jgi:predicted thioesterase
VKELTMSLTDAITAAEQAQQVYTSAVSQTTADQAVVTQIQQKLDAANATVVTDVTAQNAAATSFNASLDALIQAATAAKVPTS